MPTEMGEFVVGAYLKERLGCDFVDYNVRPPGGGMPGLGEIDVVGLALRSSTAFLCEVATHIRGLEYGLGAEESVSRIRKKFKRQRSFAKGNLGNFSTHRFMFWSPYVPKGRLTTGLARIRGLEFVINSDYTARVSELREAARASSRGTENPFFRALQILEHLRP